MLRYSQNRMPDLPWLVNVLAIVKPQHVIFKKNYSPDKFDSIETQAKYEFLKREIGITSKMFKDLPVSLLVRRKSLRYVGSQPKRGQPQEKKSKMSQMSFDEFNDFDEEDEDHVEELPEQNSEFSFSQSQQPPIVSVTALKKKHFRKVSRE